MAAAGLVPSAARAQAVNPGPIKLIVPFPPGGSTDAITRLVQPGLQQRLGVTTIIENRGGGSGSIGAAAAAKSPPDGATFLFVFDTHAVNPALIPNLPFDTEKDLDPVMLIGTAPMVLATHPSRSFTNLQDVIAAAKAKSDTLTYATIGAGSLGHLVMALLSKQAGIKVAHVPYRGGGPAVNDAVGGHVDLIIGSSALLAPQISGKNLRPLVQTSSARISSLPDVPTVTESGFPGFEANAWWGVFAPAGTPKPMTERFRADLEAAFRDEKVAKQLQESQQVTMRLEGPEEFRKFFLGQMKIWGDVVRENNIKADQ